MNIFPRPREAAGNSKYHPVRGAAFQSAGREPDALIVDALRKRFAREKNARLETVAAGAALDGFDTVIESGTPEDLRQAEAGDPSATFCLPASGSEAYALTVSSQKDKTRIVLCGVSPRARYYAALTLGQLLKSRPDGLAVPEAQIRDWPGFAIRSVKCRFNLGQPADDLHRDMDLLANLKINTVDYCYSNPLLPWNDAAPVAGAPRFTDAQVACSIQSLRARFIEPTAQIRPWVGGRLLEVSSATMMRAYLDKLDRLYDLGFRALAVCSDDLYQQPDRFEPVADMQAFQNIAEVHSRMINRVQEHLARKPDPVRLVFCPYVYVRQGRSFSVADGVIPRIAGMHGTDYLREIGQALSREVLIYWTGNYGRPHTITADDADYWADLIKRPPLLWHNSYRCYGSQPLDGLSPDLGEHVAGYMLNGVFPQLTWQADIRSRNLFAILAAMTAMDYVWNPQAYAPEVSYRAALAAVWPPIPARLHALVQKFRKANLLYRFRYDSMYVNEPLDISQAEARAWVAATRTLSGLLAEIDQEVKDTWLRESAHEFAAELFQCIRSGRILHDMYKRGKVLPPDYPREIIDNPLPRPKILDELIMKLKALAPE